MLKKVAFLFHDTDFYSGGTRSLLDLLETFRLKNQMEICAVVPYNSGSAIEYLKELKIEIVISEYYQIATRTDEGFLRKIYRFPKRLKNNIKNICNAEALAEELTRRNVNIVYSNTGFIITGALIKKKNPHMVHIWHLREFGEEDHHFGIFFGRRLYYKILNKYTDCVILISDALANKYRDHITVPYTIVHDDVSSTYYIENMDEYRKGERLSILIAGLICEGKGQREVIEAAGILREKGIPFKLYIAGGSVSRKYMETLRRIVEARKLSDSVKFLGVVKDMNCLRSRVKFGVVASASEAFGRVTIEGMLGGLLMIGADVGGTKELIDDGKTGFLYPHGDYEALAEVLIRLYRSPDCINEIRKNGKKYAQRYTNGACAKEIAKLLLSKCGYFGAGEEGQTTI